ncbi:MAG: serine/threonine-protein kinase [Verrucomicrobiota bacterium]
MPLPIVIPPGTRLYKYELTACIGGGCFGDVWLATDMTINKIVAVKILEASTVTIDERLNEARIGNQLNHQNLVKVHYADVVNHGGHDLVLIAMDYQASGSVLGKLNAANFLTIPEARNCIIDTLRGLEYLHELGLYHSDIKPNNILVGSGGEHLLTDYGISCHSPTLCPVAPRNAYRLHIAPEVLNSMQIDAHTDIYQVGLTAFRLLNGIGTLRDKYNRLGDPAYIDLVQRGRLVESADYQPFIPRALRTIVNKAISVNPMDRYQSTLDMRRALEGVVFPGYWTCLPTGVFQGHSAGNLFHFEEQFLPGSIVNFTATKTNERSCRTANVAAYCARKVTRTQADELKKKFMQFVVTGNP